MPNPYLIPSPALIFICLCPLRTCRLHLPSSVGLCMAWPPQSILHPEPAKVGSERDLRILTLSSAASPPDLHSYSLHYPICCWDIYGFKWADLCMYPQLFPDSLRKCAAQRASTYPKQWEDGKPLCIQSPSQSLVLCTPATQCSGALDLHMP